MKLVKAKFKKKINFVKTADKNQNDSWKHAW